MLREPDITTFVTFVRYAPTPPANGQEFHFVDRVGGSGTPAGGRIPGLFLLRTGPEQGSERHLGVKVDKSGKSDEFGRFTHFRCFLSLLEVY